MNQWQGGYTHHVILLCPSCEGSGAVEDALCGQCLGAGRIERGCHGVAEMDLSQGGYAYCISEGRAVPAEELSK